LEKIDMLDFADVVAINKFDKRGSLDALRDVRKQWKRNHQRFEASDDEIPVLGTIASNFDDPGTTRLYRRVMDVLAERTGAPLRSSRDVPSGASAKVAIVPPERVRYLAEIAESADRDRAFVEEQSGLATRLYQLRGAIAELRGNDTVE